MKQYTPRSKTCWEREAEALSRVQKFDHDHIVSFVGALQGGRHDSIFLEWAGAAICESSGASQIHPIKKKRLPGSAHRSLESRMRLERYMPLGHMVFLTMVLGYAMGISNPKAS